MLIKTLHFSVRSKPDLTARLYPAGGLFNHECLVSNHESPFTASPHPRVLITTEVADLEAFMLATRTRRRYSRPLFPVVNHRRRHGALYPPLLVSDSNKSLSQYCSPWERGSRARGPALFRTPHRISLRSQSAGLALMFTTSYLAMANEPWMRPTTRVPWPLGPWPKRRKRSQSN